MDLNSPQKLVSLNTALGKLRPIWESQVFRNDSGHDVADLVSALLRRVQTHRAIISTTAHQSANPSLDSAPSLSTANSNATQVAHLMVTTVTSPAFLQLEDGLAAHQLGTPLPCPYGEEKHQEDIRLQNTEHIPWWCHPIRDITLSSSGIAIKYLLGATRSTPSKVCLYMSSLRQHWVSFFNLRTVWNEFDPITSEMLSFTPTGTPALSFKSGRFAKTQVLIDILAQERKLVKGSKGVDFAQYQRAVLLTESRKLEHYKLCMDRALSAVGYPSVERHGSSPNSHGAVVDLMDDFLDIGESLSKKEHHKLKASALKFLNAAEAEAQDSYKTFLMSEDPNTPLPVPCLSKCSKAFVYLQQKTAKIKKRIQDQPFSDSSDHEVVPKAKTEQITPPLTQTPSTVTTRNDPPGVAATHHLSTCITISHELTMPTHLPECLGLSNCIML